MKKAPAIFAISAATLLLRCGFGPLAGGGTETSNGFAVGKIFSEDGSPAPATVVRLLPVNFNPVTDGPVAGAMVDTTDANGNYLLSADVSQVYNIQAVQLTARTKSLIAGVMLSKGDTSTMAGSTLRKTATIKVLLPPSINAATGYVYLPGTTLSAGIQGGSSVIDSVPAGFIPAVYFADRVDAALTRPIMTNLSVAPADTATVADYYAWKHSRKLYLNTTASGAGVGAPVLGFPVLVRLTTANFQFGEAMRNGEDIRFTKADNTPLPCEVELWDSAAGGAALWVKVDTVYGNTGSRFILMFWGNTAAASASNSAQVFDTAAGFQAVWHLDENAGKSAAEATVNRFAGVYGGDLPRTAAGIAGRSQALMDTGDYVEIGNVLNPGETDNLYLSAWVRRSAFGTHSIIAKTIGDNPFTTYGYQFTFDGSNLLRFYAASGGKVWGDDSSFYVSSNLAITDTTQWHYVAASIDRSSSGKCRIFIDGVDRSGIMAGDIAKVKNIENIENLRIGSEADTANPCDLRGSLDEVRILYTTRDENWVKLEYMNQKEPDALVEFR